MNGQNKDRWGVETGVLVLDRQGAMQYVSPQCAGMFGAKADELMGLSVFNFLFDPVIDELNRGTDFWLSDGPWRPFQGVDMQGHRFLVEVAKEKTENEGFLQLRLRHASKTRSEIDHLKRVQAAIEQSPDSVCITDDKGMIEYVNAAFEKLTGFSYQEAIGKTPALLCACSHSTEFFNLLWGRLSVGQEFCGIFIKQKKDGSRYCEEMLVRPFIDLFGRMTHFVVTGRDVRGHLQGGWPHSTSQRFNARKPLRRMPVAGQFSRKSHR